MDIRNAAPNEAVLKIRDMYFTEIDYKYNSQVDDGKQNYRFNFERKVSVNNNGNFHLVSLRCNVEDECGATEIHITLETVFECLETNNEILLSLLGINGVAIMFPYLRSQLSLVTTQPNRNPIILNAMNIVRMFEDDEERDA